MATQTLCSFNMAASTVSSTSHTESGDASAPLKQAEKPILAATRPPLPASPDKGSPASPYKGSGTASDPYLVEFLKADPENPRNFSPARKWFIIFLVTMSVFAVTITSSAYSGSADELLARFHCSREVFALGIALYVLGFAVGPALWAPLSELYGRQILFTTTMFAVTAMVAGTAGANSMAAVLVLRFFAGMFGASPLTNAGGVIADMFSASGRGLAMIFFCCAPFLGPVLGPIMGGFISENVGWRWVQGVCAILLGVVAIVGSLFIPETYGPVLLSRKAASLSKVGKPHISVLEKENGHVKPAQVFTKALVRPWVLLFREPIVFFAATYLAIIYGIAYMFLPALPIVYQQVRGWDEGIGSLAFLGLAGGMLAGVVYAMVDDKYRYQKLGKAATPESRLPPGAVGAVALPIGLFAFAWTNAPGIHWAASVILSAPFGFGCVLVFLCCLNYLIDSYAIYAASVLGASAMLRSFVGTAFPLFTSQMFHNLGIHWASSIPAFLTLICVPFPFVMYKYGEKIRMKCTYSQEAALLLAKLQAESNDAARTSSPV